MIPAHRIISWRMEIRDASQFKESLLSLFACIGTMNPESFLLLLVILLLLSALPLRVRVRKRNLQPSRRQALVLPPHAWRAFSSLPPCIAAMNRVHSAPDRNP